MDLPGMGDSFEMPIARVWTVEDDARAVAAMLDVIKHPVHFVGHSAGCVFSWPALAASPERIRSLTLFEPVFFALIEDDPTYAFPKETAEGYVRLADAGDLEGAMTFFVDRWADRAGVWAAMPEKVRSLMRKGGARLRHEWCSGLKGGFYPQDKESWVQELTAVPTLLVQGGATIPAAARVCDRFAQLRSGATRLNVPGAGHMVPFTHATDVVDTFEAHLVAN
jgi:pimeloyl-ACP methyl ester carboxylesterase